MNVNCHSFSVAVLDPFPMSVTCILLIRAWKEDLEELLIISKTGRATFPLLLTTLQEKTFIYRWFLIQKIL